MQSFGIVLILRKKERKKKAGVNTKEAKWLEKVIIKKPLTNLINYFIGPADRSD